jgi:hypothetical protein
MGRVAPAHPGLFAVKVADVAVVLISSGLNQICALPAKLSASLTAGHAQAVVAARYLLSFFSHR